MYVDKSTFVYIAIMSTDNMVL